MMDQEWRFSAFRWCNFMIELVQRILCESIAVESPSIWKAQRSTLFQHFGLKPIKATETTEPESNNGGCFFQFILRFYHYWKKPELTAPHFMVRVKHFFKFYQKSQGPSQMGFILKSAFWDIVEIFGLEMKVLRMSTKSVSNGFISSVCKILFTP